MHSGISSGLISNHDVAFKMLKNSPTSRSVLKLKDFNAWVWSAGQQYSIHAVCCSIVYILCNTINQNTDRPTTEKLNYFSAALAILYGSYYTAIRIFQPSKHPRPLLNIVFIIAYIGHLSYLTFLPRFDYAYDIAFNLTLGLTNNLLWILYSSPQSLSFIHRFFLWPKSYRPKFITKAGIFVLVTTTALELFDFPPWRGVIDAHICGCCPSRGLAFWIWLEVTTSVLFGLWWFVPHWPLCAGQADDILANSAFTARVFKEYFPSISRLPRVVYSGINLSAYERPTNSDSLDVFAVESNALQSTLSSETIDALLATFSLMNCP